MLECTSTSRLVTGAFVCWSSAGFNNATSGTEIVDAFLALDSFLSPKMKFCINNDLIWVFSTARILRFVHEN